MTKDPSHLNPSGDENFSLHDYRLTEVEAAHVDCWLGQDTPAADVCAAAENGKNAPTARLAEIIALLAQSREPAVPPGLAHRTMATVRQRAFPGRFVGAGNMGHKLQKRHIGWDRRKIDLAAMTVAAGLLFVILISGINHARFVAARTACAGNLTALARAFSGYAADYAGMLPSIAPPTDGNWLPRADTPGQPRSANAHSNLANLRPLLARGRFVSWNRMICPSCRVQSNLGHVVKTYHGLPTGDMNYSYLDQLAAYHHHWGGTGSVVVMADYNPFFQAGADGVTANSNSFNHTRRGENILCDDGSVRWVTNPNAGPRGDNIWTVQGDSKPPFTGREEPKTRYDILVVP